MRKRQILQRRHIVFVEIQYRQRQIDSLFQQPALVITQTQILIRPLIVRFQIQHPFKAFHGFLPLADPVQQTAQIQQDIRLIWGSVPLLQQMFPCVGHLAQLPIAFSQPVMGALDIRIQLQGLMETFQRLAEFAPVQMNLPQIMVGGGVFRFQFQNSMELLQGAVQLIPLQQQNPRIQQHLHIPRIAAQLLQKILSGPDGIVFGPISLSNSVLNLRVLGIKFPGLLPAPDRPVIQLPGKKGIADIVIAQRTFRLQLLRQIKHLLRFLMLAHLRIRNNPVAVPRLKMRRNFLQPFKGFQCFLIVPHPRIVHTQTI
ncbi:MAG: hypothetical protein BWY71_01064 [Planctomycetes bacterium ADurb.Bin412]|nr:MAG: hypothetical protein BWY71_01064 [Planctomycetes bacterium ADurb.Bin412]